MLSEGTRSTYKVPSVVNIQNEKQKSHFVLTKVNLKNYAVLQRVYLNDSPTLWKYEFGDARQVSRELRRFICATIWDSLQVKSFLSPPADECVCSAATCLQSTNTSWQNVPEIYITISSVYSPVQRRIHRLMGKYRITCSLSDINKIWNNVQWYLG